MLKAKLVRLQVTGVNLASSSMCAILCWVFGLISWPGRMSFDFYLQLALVHETAHVSRTCESCSQGMGMFASPRRLFGLAVFHWGGMLFSNISVSEVHISFTHTVKVRGARVDRDRLLLYQSST